MDRTITLRSVVEVVEPGQDFKLKIICVENNFTMHIGHYRTYEFAERIGDCIIKNLRFREGFQALFPVESMNQEALEEIKQNKRLRFTETSGLVADPYLKKIAVFFENHEIPLRLENTHSFKAVLEAVRILLGSIDYVILTTWLEAWFERLEIKLEKK